MNRTSLEKMIGYEFQDPLLLKKALTHSSVNPVAGGDGNNQRLEFLGDAVFDLIISKYLYDRLPYDEEGKLSRARSLVVCEKSLAECGKRLKINEALQVGKGEEQSGVLKRSSVLADAAEALITAVYLDGGLDAASSFVLSVFEDTIEKALSGMLYRDYKTELQELLQAKKEARIHYHVDREDGPDHDKTFFVSLWDGERKIGEGMGKTKKEAEQNAAKAVLEG
ncbi:MAG TPA: ribonuclease III [Bacillota bacterium]|nr:ribonuclease III [Bacillota bacterium]